MQTRILCKQKMKSESGASLAVALLFFIVCAVVGSIIIAAAMSSAGRMSGIISADAQRYALDSARGLVENTMLSDTEDEGTWYVNENELQATAAGGTWKNGFKPQNSVLKNNLVSLREVELSMAEELYQLYWGSGEIQNSWPQKDAAGNAQETVAEEVLAGATASTGTEDRSISQNGSTDTKTTSAWVPSGKIETAKYPERQATLTLTGTNISSDAIPAVTAKFTMHPDFSIHIELSTSASSENGTESATEKFVLYPSITMDYESVKSSTDDAALTEAENEQNIRCVIRWMDVGEEQTK